MSIDGLQHGKDVIRDILYLLSLHTTCLHISWEPSRHVIHCIIKFTKTYSAFCLDNIDLSTHLIHKLEYIFARMGLAFNFNLML